MDQHPGVGRAPLPALEVLVDAADAGLHPWVREHVGPAERRAALAEELGFWLTTAAQDMSYAASFAAAAPQSGEPPESYLDRWLALGSGGHVLAGPRYLGRDPDLPFVMVTAADRPLRAGDRDALAAVAAGHFAAFRPGFVMVTTADPAGAWPRTRPEMRQVVGRLTDLRNAPTGSAPGAASGRPASTSGGAVPAGTSDGVAPAATSGGADPAATPGGRASTATFGEAAPAASSGGPGLAAGWGGGVPVGLALTACVDVGCYERYADVHRRHVEREPAHARHARREDREDLQALADGGTLFDVRVGGVWAGLVAAEPDARRGVRGFTVVELLLDDAYRGHGYGRHLSTLLARALPGGDGLCLLGTIHQDNTAAYRAALSAGRVDVGGEIVIPL